jgi:adenosine deaminase
MLPDIYLKEQMTWFERIPKVEIHLHLEGAIPYKTLWEILQKYGGHKKIPTAEALKQKFQRYKDFTHFLELWRWKNSLLREYEDFTFIAQSVAEELARQNIRYTEIFFSPASFARRGLETQPLTEAIRRGLSRVEGVKVALVADLVRDYGPETASVTLAQIQEVRDLGVIGVTIGGSEHRFPPEPFASVFEEARLLGFYTSAHAGENAGSKSIWGVLNHLKVDRIGHGIRAEEDPNLLQYLASSGIPLEICPISNVRLGVVDSIECHPVRRFYDQGIVITINTDDPAMFNCTLAQELQILHEKMGFTQEDIQNLIIQAIKVSWMPPSEKECYITSFKNDRAWGNEETK